MRKTIVTHSGSFHTDDIFAVATLLIRYPDAEVVRSRDPLAIKAADIAVDVGWIYDPAKLRFDHHQLEGGGKRENGIPYASFGLVWKEYGKEISGSQEVADLIDKKLVMSVDAPDNAISIFEPNFKGVLPYTIGDFMYSYIVHGNDDEIYLYKAFMSAVSIAKDLIQREILKGREKIDGIKEVQKILSNIKDKSIIVLDKKLPWEEVIGPDPDAMFVIYPRMEGNWGAKSIPSSLRSFSRKKLMPESWAGKEGEELRRITGVDDAVFCHRNGFMATAESKEGAIKLAKLALKA